MVKGGRPGRSGPILLGIRHRTGTVQGVAIGEGSPEVPDFQLQHLHPGLVAQWEATATPLAIVKMRIWLLQRLIEGPPIHYGYSADDLPYTKGPSEETIEYVHIPKPLKFGVDPPVGVTIIRSITNPS